MSQPLLIMSTLPDRASAERIARSLVEAGLVACASVGGALHSVYRWQGKVESAEEFLLSVKTTEDNYERVEAALRAQHPYELPEIVGVSITRGLTPYLRWIDAETH
jgi:periplasmic divalent cation tolerance protein